MSRRTNKQIRVLYFPPIESNRTKGIIGDRDLEADWDLDRWTLPMGPGPISTSAISSVSYPLTHPDATRAVGGSDTYFGRVPIGSVQRSRSQSASRSRSPIIPLVRLELSTDSSESSDEGDSDYQPQLDNVRAPGRRRNRRLRRVPRQPRMHLQPEPQLQPQPEPMVQDPQPGPSRRQESPEVMRPDEIGWNPEEKLREVRVLRGPLTDELILVRNGRIGCRLCPFNAPRDSKRWRNIYRHLSTHVEQSFSPKFKFKFN